MLNLWNINHAEVSGLLWLGYFIPDKAAWSKCEKLFADANTFTCSSIVTFFTEENSSPTNVLQRLTN